jgi:hypothetical protein
LRHPDATGEPILYSGDWLTGKPKMSHDYPSSRLQELLQLKSKLEAGPSQEMVVAVASVLLVPANTERRAYSVLREIYLKRYEEFAAVLFDFNSYASAGKGGMRCCFR